jgi:hypothetical protein
MLGHSPVTGRPRRSGSLIRLAVLQSRRRHRLIGISPLQVGLPSAEHNLRSGFSGSGTRSAVAQQLPASSYPLSSAALPLNFEAVNHWVPVGLMQSSFDSPPRTSMVPVHLPALLQLAKLPSPDTTPGIVNGCPLAVSELCAGFLQNRTPSTPQSGSRWVGSHPEPKSAVP